MDNSVDLLNYFLRLLLGTVLPWGGGALAVAGALSLTPFGQGLIHYLRSRHRDSESLDLLLQEITAIRAALVEVAERMDAAEQRILQAGPQRPGSLKGDSLPAPGTAIATPH